MKRNCLLPDGCAATPGRMDPLPLAHGGAGLPGVAAR
jgi:hypothetical protein